MSRIGLAVIAAAIAAAGGFVVLNHNNGLANPAGFSAKQRPADDSGATSEGQATLTAGVNDFAVDMYRELRLDNEGNLFFSPWSIDSVLAMAGEGTAGQTASEIFDAGRLPASAEQRRASFAALHNALNPSQAQFQLSTANALWIQQAYPLKQHYIDLIERFYCGGARNLDFAGKTEAARQTINAWVEERTNDRIKDLFAPGSLTAQTRLVLTNAVYFKGKWEHEFKPERTMDEPFHLTTGQTVDVPMMKLREQDAWLQYAKSESWQAVKLPYKGEELSMLLVLPAQSSSLAELEKGLDTAAWQSIIEQLQGETVVVQVPRFKFNTRYTLNPYLQALGMRQAFSQQADFSGMADTGELFVDLVIHQAFVEVNEEGTEAAAATGMAVAGSAAPMNQPPLFRADRPFLFAIVHEASGLIVFMGRVLDPSK